MHCMSAIQQEETTEVLVFSMRICYPHISHSSFFMGSRQLFAGRLMDELLGHHLNKLLYLPYLIRSIC